MPTLKAEEFCQAFYTWAEACQTELPTDAEDQNMIESCEILVTSWEGGQVVAGAIILKDGKLSVSATKGYEMLMQNVMEDKTFIAERVLDPANDPRAWVQSLPSFYTGSIVRAKLVKS